MSIIGDHQFNLNQYNSFKSQLTWTPLQASNYTTGDLTPSKTSKTEAQFKLPYNKHTNLAQTTLDFDIDLASQGVGKGSSLILGAAFLDSLVLETSNGFKLVDIQEVNKFCSIVVRPNTKIDQIVGNDDTSLLYATENDLITMPNGIATDTLLETQYRKRSDAATAMSHTVSFRLGDFLKHSYLAIDKSFYYGNTDLFFKFNFAPYDKWVYKSNATADAADDTVPESITDGSLTITNLKLQLAIENNKDYMATRKASFEGSGYTVLTDYPYVNRVVSAGGTNQNMLVNLTATQGKTLKKIYHSVFDNTDTLNLSHDNSNRDYTNTSGVDVDKKINKYNTFIDSVQQNPNEIDTVDNLEPWRLLKTRLKSEKSCVLNRKIHEKNWYHVDDFSGSFSNQEVTQLPDQNIIDGMPIDKNVLYQFVTTDCRAAQFIHISVAVFTRVVRISSMGLEYV
jgi:hypothetical protein